MASILQSVCNTLPEGCTIEFQLVFYFLFGLNFLKKFKIVKQYLSKANICQETIFGKSQYLAKANILKKPLFGKSQYLSKANICQKPIFIESQYLAKADIWQKQLAILSIITILAKLAIFT
jgi:hypothetical protein